MLVFVYDQSYEGLLTLIFEAFRIKAFPTQILAPGDQVPLLAERVEEITTDLEKADRVWAGLQTKLSDLALKQILRAYLSEETSGAEWVLRYVRAIYRGVSEANFKHPDVLALRQLSQQVGHEAERVRQFVRFQKTVDGLFFAGVSPRYNVLPLTLSHFRGRYRDQPWIIYDLKRNYGFYYDLEDIREIYDYEGVDPQSGRLNPERLAADEDLLQEAWRGYFKSVSIKQRANPRLQKQYMPKRFWPYLTEMQDSKKESGGD